MMTGRHRNNPFALKKLLASTCLTAVPVLISGALAQEIDEIGTDLGRGADKGTVNGGSIDVSGAPTVRGVGVSTGSGSDKIKNVDAIDVMVGAADDIVWTGFSASQTGLDVSAEGIGFFGDTGRDTLVNSDEITVDVGATGEVVNLGLNLFGFFNFNAPSTVDAFGIGIDGGLAFDQVENNSLITVNAISGLSMIGQGPSSFDGNAIVEITSIAGAVGMRGTRNGQTTRNAGELMLTADATAQSTVLDVEIVNGAVVDSATNALSTVYGIEGDTIRDTIVNDGAMSGTSTATAIRGAGALSLSDGGVADNAVDATAMAIGVTGGRSDDTLTNNGDVTMTSNAETQSTNVEINLLDVGGGSFSLAPLSISKGLDGGDNDDALSNSGFIDVTANSDSFSNSVNLSLVDVTIIGGRIAAGLDDSPGEDGEPPIQALAIGLDGGEGEDTLFNDGDISLTGDANAESVSISVATIGVPDAAFQAIFAGESLASHDTFASSRIIGMSGGGWDDELTNLGSITGVTTSTAQQIGVAVSTPSGFLPDEAGFLPGFTLGGAGSGAFADAIGMSGGGGDDMLLNSSIIHMMSTADAFAVSVSVELPEAPSGDGAGVDLSLTLADVDTTATAEVSGMAGGEGDDTLVNDETGVIDAVSSSTSTSTGVGVTSSFEKEGVISEGVIVRAKTNADAVATAIDGGEGDDEILNEGAANAMATATADTFGFTLALEGVASGGAAGIAAVDGSATADATAQAISGGEGSDLLINTGALDANATANASADSVSVALTGAKTAGFAGGGTLSLTGATATADASGVGWASNDQGAENRGSIMTNATANAQGDAVSIGISGALNGFTLNASLADASTTANATASAFDAPTGNHEITNFETLSAISNADADSDSASVELGVVVQGGLSAGVALTRATTTADATSTGIVSDVGFDEITNIGTITADATSKANSTSVGIGLNGTLTGVAINASAADGSATATSTAEGISTGLFDDIVTSAGAITSKSEAMGNTDSVSIAIAIAGQAGVAAGGALARAGVTADADAVGVATGAGADKIGAAGVVDVMTTAMADSDAVSIAGQGTAAGLTLGATIVDAQTNANADASGLHGGEGDDEVQNRSMLRAASTAKANSTSVGVQIGAAGAGLTGGLSLANTQTTAVASTGGVEGGLGADLISNATNVDADATAEGKGASVAVSLNGTLKGGAISVALTDATVDATSFATGIAGDDAAGADEQTEENEDADASAPSPEVNADTIINSGVIMVDSFADSTGTSVSIAAPVAFVPVGFALATAANTATSNAFGIDGGLGNDIITNTSGITTKANTDLSGASVAASLTVGALGDFDGKGFANAYGITGGLDDDQILNDELVMTTADTDVSGVSVNLTILGAAVGDLSTRAEADAIGLFGDIGSDILVNDDRVITDAIAKAGSTNVSLSYAGFALDDVSTKAFADATGLHGGEGDDALQNSADVTTTATATTPSVTVSFTGTGAPINDAETRSDSDATGLDGGAGDDEIVSEGVVTSTSTASTTGTGVSVVLTGAAFADVQTVSDAGAAGLAGGSGADAIVNRGELNATSTATASTTGVGVNITGASFADADAMSFSHAAGISGDSGDDEILNAGEINATSTANVGATSVNVSIAGATIGDVSTTANASATGIEGGSGDDLIGHEGAITTTTTANANAQTVSVGLIGAALADITLTAETDSIGVDGGTGDDKIITFEGSTVDVNASIAGNANNTTVQLVGGTSNKNVFGLTPSATGFDGGDGGDLISLYGTADIDATSSFTLNNTAISLIGVAFDDSGVTSDPTATGVAGGAGDDVIYVDDLLDARAVNMFSMNNLSVNLAGYSSSKPTVGGTSEAIGIDAGEDNDIVMSEGRIVANASSTNTVSGNQITLLGANQSNAEVGADSSASGILGGGGDDTLLTSGVTDIDASATARLNSLSFTLAGASITDGAIRASASGIGHNAGAGDDVAGNFGDLFVDTNASLTTSGAVGVSFGAAISGASTTSTATSTGMFGGDGADYLFNTDFIRARSTASGSISRTNYAFIGGSSNSAAANATAISLGIGGGAGDDEIENVGTVEVRATSSTTASGNTIATVGGARSSSTVAATARSVGLAGDAGGDVIKNFSSLIVTASASPDSTNSANTGGFFTDGVTNSRTTTSTRVIGVDGGSGANTIWNTGSMTVQTSGLARTESRSKGDILDNIFGLDLDARATSTSSNNGQDARGVSAGGEATTFFNSGALNVSIRGAGYAFSDADGDAIVNGDGTATATVGVSSARAYGFVAGSGDNTFLNTGNITVLSRPTGNADARSDGDGIEAVIQPDSRATANVSVNSARAAGVWLNNGDDMIVNEGSMTVTAEPRADRAEADALFGGDTLGIDSFATARASANNAAAYGVRAGNGDNVIHNTGSIVVTSKPRAVADARARAIGLDGDAIATAVANVQNAIARGVETGSGDDLIWNDGAITAISNPTGAEIAAARGTVGGDEEENANSASISGRSAIAVASGSGNDTVVNAGSITATHGTSVGSGAAINTGTGNDVLALLDGSSARGSVNLSSGNDTLLLSGTPTTSGNPSGSTGFDTVQFDGAGSYSRALLSFEAAEKSGGGLFAIPVLPVMQSVSVLSGTLQTSSGYAFNSGGVFKAYVDGDGTFGQFAVGGTATLAGGVELIAGPSLFSDGQSFDVITASSVNGSFASETLPAATPLLSFDLSQGSNAVQVIASVESFMTVAPETGVDQAFAEQLDEAALVAGGALSESLARIQRLPSGADFEGELASLNPARFDEVSRDATATMELFEAGARQRLASLRQLNLDGAGGSGFVGGTEPVRFAQSARFDIGNGVSYGAWRSTFGGLENTAGENHGIVTGADYLLPSGTAFGGSFGAVRSRSFEASLSTNEAQIDSYMMSFYGSQRLGQNGYLDAMVSYAQQDALMVRPFSSAGAVATSPAEHEGAHMRASVEAGRAFAFAGGRAETFGGLRFGALSEEGFDAVTGGGLAVSLDQRDANQFETEIGMRAGWKVDIPAGTFTPRVSMSWSHRIGLSGNRLQATFADAPGYEFNLPSALHQKNALRLGAGVDLWNVNNLTLTSRMETDVLASESSVNGVLELTIGF